MPKDILQVGPLQWGWIIRRHGTESFGGRELSFNAAEKRNKLAPFHRLSQTQDVGIPPAVAAVDEVGPSWRWPEEYL